MNYYPQYGVQQYSPIYQQPQYQQQTQSVLNGNEERTVVKQKLSALANKIA